MYLLFLKNHNQCSLLNHKNQRLNIKTKILKNEFIVNAWLIELT